MFDPTVDFTAEQLVVVNDAEVTVPALREFWSRFPTLTLEDAIGSLKGEVQAKEDGKEVAPVPEEVAPVNETVPPPVPAPAAE